MCKGDRSRTGPTRALQASADGLGTLTRSRSLPKMARNTGLSCTAAGAACEWWSVTEVEGATGGR